MSEQVDWRPLIKWLTLVLEGLSSFLDKLSLAQTETKIDPNSNVVEIWNKAFSSLIKDISKEEFVSIAEIAYTLGRFNNMNIQTLSPQQLSELGTEAKKASEKLKRILGEK